MSDEVIGGYRLLKHLVTGQTSQVWEVVEVASHRHFAMKMLLPEKYHIPTGAALLVIAGVLGFAVLASVLLPRKEEPSSGAPQA